MKQVGKKRFLAVMLSVVMAMTLFAGMTLTVSAADQDIVVLFTNDVHCGVDDNIGYAGLSLYKQQMQAKTPYVTLVDAGDHVQGAPIGTLSKGAFIIDIMNQVGYDVVVPGNHEFDYNMEQLLTLNKRLNGGYVSCNFMDLKTNRTVFAPYKILTYGDTKVAYVGITTPESFTKSTPAYFQDKKGNYIYGLSEDETGEKLYAAVQLAVDTAKAEGADIVIAVAHLGQEGTTERWTSDAVIKSTNGIDVMFDGHSHEEYIKSVKNKDGKNVTLVQTGTKLANIGKLTINTKGKIKADLVDEVKGGPEAITITVGSETQEIPFSGSVEPVTDVFIKALQNTFEGTLSRKVGTTGVDLTVKNPATGNRQVRSGETNLGDLCADAYREVLKTDIAFVNGGGVRADVKKGDITYKDVLTVHPFNNMACVIEVSGQIIWDALEMGAHSYPDENGGFLQVSGLSYTINSGVASPVVLDEKGNFLKVEGEHRVTDVMIAGKPLDVNKTYTLGSHNYMLLDAGDGYTMFKGCKVLRDNVMPDVDVLTTHIEQNLKGNVGQTYSNPAGQGRITIK